MALLDYCAGQRAVGIQLKFSFAREGVVFRRLQCSMDQLAARIGDQQGVSILEFRAQIAQWRVFVGGVEDQVSLSVPAAEHAVIGIRVEVGG